MKEQIDYDHWQSLSVIEIKQLFAETSFAWALAGGYAIEQFVGKPIRDHDDIDIVVFRDNQLAVQHWLADWQLYAADPPGTLRPWLVDEYLPFGIHDIWGHRNNVQAWQLQIMLAEVEGEEWFSRRNPLVRGKRAELFAEYQGTPCIRVEVQLLYKARALREKDQLDFHACLPLMSTTAKQWLTQQLRLSFPEDHSWLSSLR